MEKYRVYNWEEFGRLVNEGRAIFYLKDENHDTFERDSLHNVMLYEIGDLIEEEALWYSLAPAFERITNLAELFCLLLKGEDIQYWDIEDNHGIHLEAYTIEELKEMLVEGSLGRIL